MEPILLPVAKKKTLDAKMAQTEEDVRRHKAGDPSNPARFVYRHREADRDAPESLDDNCENGKHMARYREDPITGEHTDIYEEAGARYVKGDELLRIARRMQEAVYDQYGETPPWREDVPGPGKEGTRRVAVDEGKKEEVPGKKRSPSRARSN